MKRVDAVYFSSPPKLPKPAGLYRFELTDGDVLFGSLLQLDDKLAELDIPQVGRLHLKRYAIRQFSRWKDGSGLVYQGPNGFDDWNAMPAPRGQTSTDSSPRRKPAVACKQGSPFPRAAVNVALSWESKPDFVLALGVGG